MQLGIAYFPTDYSIRPAALALAAEERGFESMWVAEHSHIPISRKSPWPGGAELPKRYYDVMDPFVALASAASVTKRIRLGTGVCLVVQRDTIQTAKAVASLDQLSDGRFLFGVGGGWNAEEMADHGTEFRTRFKLMRERVAAMKAIWTEAKPAYDGDLVKFEPMMSWPKPVQKPHPPIIVGGGFPHGAKRAIAWGDGWMPLGGRDLDVAAVLPQFRQMAEEAGRDPASLEITVYGAPAEAERLRAFAREPGSNGSCSRSPPPALARSCRCWTISPGCRMPEPKERTMTTQIEVGDIEVRRVVEQEGPFFDPLKFFPDLTQERLDENRAWLEPQALDPATGQIVLCVQSYVLRTPERTILVDTCVGNHKERVTRPFWHMRTDESYMRALAEAGLTVDDIDLVLCTHLHPDHVGWNTRLAGGRWVPTFPNARYLFSEREFTHWRERHAEAPIAYMADSVLPIVEAGRADFVRSDRRIDERVRLEPTPGHTIDHFAVRFGSAGEEGVVTGDLIHSPLQCRYPELSVFVDYDKVQSARTRRSLLEGCAADGTLVCTAHFPSPSMGRIARREDGFRFEPV